MTYIHEFTIEGLAGRKDVVHRKLDRHVNIFWGLNGSGKTSLLKILHSALKYDASLLTRVPFESAEVIFQSTAYNTRIRRTIVLKGGIGGRRNGPESDESQLEDIGDGLRREVESAKSEEWVTEVLDGTEFDQSYKSFKHTYLPISRVGQMRPGRTFLDPGMHSQGQVVNDVMLDELFAEQVRRKWQTYNNAALVEIRHTQQKGLAAILSVLFGGADGGELPSLQPPSSDNAYQLVCDFLGDQNLSLGFDMDTFRERYETRIELQRGVALIQEVTNKTEETLRPQREFQSVVQSMYSGNKHLLLGDSPGPRSNALQVEVDGNVIPLESLSSGEKQLLRLMLETLASGENTVMIDEPELSMHVDWQQRLVQSMRLVNRDCQLLLATHSPEIMADVEDDFVFQL